MFCVIHRTRPRLLSGTFLRSLPTTTTTTTTPPPPIPQCSVKKKGCHLVSCPPSSIRGGCHENLLPFCCLNGTKSSPLQLILCRQMKLWGGGFRRQGQLCSGYSRWICVQISFLKVPALGLCKLLSEPQFPHLLNGHRVIGRLT